MKPLNLDNSPCSPISSNCVIWSGNDIPCINLCKGDTVSDVVFKLATELCTVLDTLNVNNYDLACLNLAGCDPKDFQALIQLLINKICELEGIPVPAPQPDGGACPTNCIVAVADCLGGGNDNLISYVQTIATKVCDLVSQITIIQNSITNINVTLVDLQTQIDNLPIYNPPTVSISCQIGSLITPGAYQMDTLLDAFINDVWCSYYATTGTTTELVAAVGQICIADGDLQKSNGLPFSANPLWIQSAAYGTVADAINNIWIALCDLYNGLPIVDVVGTDDITVTSATVGTTTTFTVGRTPKINFYDEAVATVDVTTDPAFVNLTYFMPTAYAGLIYTNTSGVSKDYIVTVSYDQLMQNTVGGAGSDLSDWLDGAIVKNAAVILYESISRPSINVNLFDSVTGLPITSVTAETVITTPSSHPVVPGVQANSNVPLNKSFFKKVTLNAGETVSLKFKSKSGGSGILERAQIFVQEL
jgi:hypothetical protein